MANGVIDSHVYGPPGARVIEESTVSSGSVTSVPKGDTGEVDYNIRAYGLPAGEYCWRLEDPGSTCTLRSCITVEELGPTESVNAPRVSYDCGYKNEEPPYRTRGGRIYIPVPARGTFRVDWTDGAPENALNREGLAAGTYSYRLYDQCGFVDSQTITIVDPLKGVELSAVPTCNALVRESGRVDLSQAKLVATRGYRAHTVAGNSSVVTAGEFEVELLAPSCWQRRTITIPERWVEVEYRAGCNADGGELELNGFAPGASEIRLSVNSSPTTLNLRPDGSFSGIATGVLPGENRFALLIDNCTYTLDRSMLKHGGITRDFVRYYAPERTCEYVERCHGEPLVNSNYREPVDTLRATTRPSYSWIAGCVLARYCDDTRVSETHVRTRVASKHEWQSAYAQALAEHRVRALDSALYRGYLDASQLSQRILYCPLSLRPIAAVRRSVNGGRWVPPPSTLTLSVGQWINWHDRLLTVDGYKGSEVHVRANDLIASYGRKSLKAQHCQDVRFCRRTFRLDTLELDFGTDTYGKGDSTLRLGSSDSEASVGVAARRTCEAHCVRDCWQRIVCLGPEEPKCLTCVSGGDPERSLQSCYPEDVFGRDATASAAVAARAVRGTEIPAYHSPHRIQDFVHQRDTLGQPYAPAALHRSHVTSTFEPEPLGPTVEYADYEGLLGLDLSAGATIQSLAVQQLTPRQIDLQFWDESVATDYTLTAPIGTLDYRHHGATSTTLALAVGVSGPIYLDDSLVYESSGHLAHTTLLTFDRRTTRLLSVTDLDIEATPSTRVATVGEAIYVVAVDRERSTVYEADPEAASDAAVFEVPGHLQTLTADGEGLRAVSRLPTTNPREDAFAVWRLDPVTSTVELVTEILLTGEPPHTDHEPAHRWLQALDAYPDHVVLAGDSEVTTGGYGYALSADSVYLLDLGTPELGPRAISSHEGARPVAAYRHIVDGAAFVAYRIPGNRERTDLSSIASERIVNAGSYEQVVTRAVPLGLPPPDTSAERLTLAQRLSAKPPRLAPNPARDRVRVLDLSPELVYAVELVDVAGRRVFRVTKQWDERGTLDLALPRLPAGIYLVKVAGQSGGVTLRLVISD